MAMWAEDVQFIVKSNSLSKMLPRFEMGLEFNLFGPLKSRKFGELKPCRDPVDQGCQTQRHSGPEVKT